MYGGNFLCCCADQENDRLWHRVVAVSDGARADGRRWWRPYSVVIVAGYRMPPFSYTQVGSVCSLNLINFRSFSLFGAG